MAYCDEWTMDLREEDIYYDSLEEIEKN